MQLEEVLERCRVVALPMAVQFRGVTVREALLIEGPAGWGEFAPFLEYPAPEAAAWLAAGLEAAYQGFPPPLRDKVEVNGTIPAVEASRVPEIMARYPGCRTFKVKVAEPGQSVAEDVARVEAVRAELARQGIVGTIRVDANGGWTVPEAFDAALALGPLEYLEQPCRSAEELAQLRQLFRDKAVEAHVAADESIRRSPLPFKEAVMHLGQLEACDTAVVKAAPLGGVSNVLGLAEELEKYQVNITVASALDTAVGISMGLAAAAALPHSAAAGLATGSLFVEDVCAPRTVVDGYLSVQRVVPERARLEALEARPERKDWWLRRVRECWEYLPREVMSSD